MAAPDRDEACPHCGMTYGEFRTGLTYGDVYLMLWSHSDDPTTWRYKRRHTILGLWMSIKRDQWTAHLAECEYEAEQMAEIEEIESAGYAPAEFLF